jgi:outer membrane protein OmpA-like peptidoglycan-associated protein
MQIFLNSLEDIGWLLQTHLKGCNIIFNSFILTGNEDCPDKVGCPPGSSPTGRRDAEGNFECEDAEGNKHYVDPNGNHIYTIDKNGKRIDIELSKGPVRLVHIFYDFDKANIRADAKPGLDSLVTMLKNFPEASVKFTSHTDARGIKRYNRSLSDRRAESVVRYLIANGISKKRLKAQGMGEDVMINDCYDGIPCDEEQHQENRRTEFVVTNWDGTGKEFKSQKDMKGVKIDRCTNCEKAPTVEEGTAAPKDETNNN